MRLELGIVYKKLINTAFKYTPVVLKHHCPYKSLSNGQLYVVSSTLRTNVAHDECSKGPSQTPKWKTLQKLVLSYFHNAMHLLTQLTDSEILILALTETSKLVPYITGNRKSVKVYLKVGRRSIQLLSLGLILRTDMSPSLVVCRG